MPRKKVPTLICLLVCFGALPASAFLDFSDGGVLVSTKTVKGMTNEAYSDGYVARYNLFGFRDENTAAGRRITMSQLRDGFEAEGRGYVEVPPSTWAPNDSGKQSRLRQYVETCLANEHGAKALGEASLYYDIQQRTGAKGLPLALSRELLGQVYLQCGRRDEALPFLQAACSEVDLLTSLSLQKQFKRNLMMAQKAKNFKPVVAVKQINFEDSKEKVVALQTRADAAFKEDPYSNETFEENEHLLENYLAEQNWTLLKQACVRLIKIEERKPDRRLPQFGCSPPVTSRLDYYLGAAKADFKLGNKEEAKTWLEKAQKELPAIARGELFSLTKMNIEFGELASASKLLDEATKSDDWVNGYRDDVPYLFRQVGRPDEAEKAQNAINLHRKKKT